ncbi:MAG: DUF4886 domain-containing protein [Armatimonadetes bacterium]|nr:DUF4886 domain-containing protein [Armatimonadota bacterium]
MKKTFHFFLLLVCVLLGHITSAQARTVRVFVIGNSFSQNATRYLPELAKEGGHELVIGRAELGGHSLKQHWSYVEAAEANPADPKGKAYGAKTLRELFSAGTWDIVTIQQASIFSSDVETYRPYAQKLRDYIKSLQPWAEVVLHQTWAYRSDAKSFGFLNEKTKERTQDQREMWAKLHGAYYTIAREIGVRVIPVGDVFWRVSSDPKWGYQKDPNFNFEKPVHPALPDQSYSLHAGYRWGNPTNFAFDANHANSAGCYLAGLVWYRFLFDESPAKLTFVPKDVNPDFAAYLRGIRTAKLRTL